MWACHKASDFSCVRQALHIRAPLEVYWAWGWLMRRAARSLRSIERTSAMAVTGCSRKGRTEGEYSSRVVQRSHVQLSRAGSDRTGSPRNEKVVFKYRSCTFWRRTCHACPDESLPCLRGVRARLGQRSHSAHTRLFFLDSAFAAPTSPCRLRLLLHLLPTPLSSFPP